MHDIAPGRTPTFVTAYTLSSALGVGNGATADSLHAERGGLRAHDLRVGGTTWLGVIDDIGDEPIAGDLDNYDCRSNRILGRAILHDGFAEAVGRARNRYGAHRVGCFVGTIGAGLGHLEERYRRAGPGSSDLGAELRVNQTAHLFSVTEYCRRVLGISGPAATVSTACSSSAKIFCTADRYLRAGLCDAVVVGGVDCANEGFLYGFRSLGLLSTSPCRPWDRRRNGLSIGEAAGFALLERAPSGDSDIALLGFGESGDAYHMAAPHPEGEGAETAMRSALRSAGLEASEIDYINLHGSGTPANDASEDRAVLRVFGNATPCSSTKGWTGHAQGAAGITEAIISILSVEHGVVPGTLNTTEPDQALRANVILENQRRPLRRALTNSFGFGGNNCALIFGATQ
jgi:3-oxoacyl-[acyl-carrier-protein] synthase-1